MATLDHCMSGVLPFAAQAKRVGHAKMYSNCWLVNIFIVISGKTLLKRVSVFTF